MGTQATLTLNQSSSDTGLVPDGAGQIIISNRYAGSGTYNAANGSYSGSVFNVNLSDEVAGYELVFTDTASDYTGLINLTNAAVTAYDKDRTVKDDETGTEYTPNALLESATLQLQSGSHLKVTDKGSVHNLIIADENTSIVFDNLDLGTGILEIDNLSLQNTGKVEIDNIGSGLQGAADELGYLEADGGITQEIIRVSGTIVGDRNDMVLAGDALQEKQTELSTDDVEADLYWNFDPNLIFNDKDKTYSAKYGLTKVNVESGQFVLEAKEGATEATADFTAQIPAPAGCASMLRVQRLRSAILNRVRLPTVILAPQPLRPGRTSSSPSITRWGILPASMRTGMSIWTKTLIRRLRVSLEAVC